MRNDANNWADDIPLLLSFKEDLSCPAAELVLGTLLSLPGQYFSPNNDFTPTSAFNQELRLQMAKLGYTPPRQRPADIYLPQQLQKCDFVFVKNDADKRPLTPA